MSHFSTIKTKIKNKPELIEALQLLQYEVQEDQELINPIDHQHEKVKVDISIGEDIGFRLNNNGEYEFCLLYTSPSPRDVEESRMPSSA